MSTIEYFEGFKTTAKGRALIAKLLATETLVFSRVMAGSGRCPNVEAADTLEDLIVPEMEGTSTTPVYDLDTVTMELEIRSDLNGGVETGFWIYEVGVFAIDPDEGEILLYYGSLGDMPNYIPSGSSTREATFRYPVAITVGEGAGGVSTGYPANAFVSHENLKNHNLSETSHPALVSKIATLPQLFTGETLPEGVEGPYIWFKPFSGTFPDEEDVPEEDTGGKEEDAYDLGVNLTLTSDPCDVMAVVDGVTYGVANAILEGGDPATVTFVN